MTIVSSYCGSCGAANLGTPFCESCGASMGPAQVAPPAEVAAPALPVNGSASTVARNGLSEPALRALRWGAVGSYAFLQFLWVISTASQTSFLYLGAGQAVAVLLTLASGILAAVAGFAGSATAGRRVGGGVAALGFLLLSMLSILNPVWWYNAYDAPGYFFASLVDFLVIPGLGFLSWGLSRPFRGPGWLGGIPIVVSALVIGILYGIGVQLTYVLALVLSVLVIPVVIAIPWWKERHQFGAVPAAALSAAATPAGAMSAVAPVSAGLAPNETRTNTLALLALIFGVLGSAVLPIVLGHIALSQIARTGEQGRGMAIAGIVLGWIASAAIVVILIIYAVTIASLASLGSGLYY
jgi:hypothetical protein